MSTIEGCEDSALRMLAIVIANSAATNPGGEPDGKRKSKKSKRKSKKSKRKNNLKQRIIHISL